MFHKCEYIVNYRAITQWRDLDCLNLCIEVDTELTYFTESGKEKWRLSSLHFTQSIAIHNQV